MSTIEKILDLISKNNISARELCIELDISVSSITDWKNGRAKPSAEAIVKISNYFNVTTDYLLKDNYNIDETARYEIANNATFSKWIDIYRKATKALKKEQVIQCIYYFEGYVDAIIKQFNN